MECLTTKPNEILPLKPESLPWWEKPQRRKCYVQRGNIKGCVRIKIINKPLFQCSLCLHEMNRDLLAPDGWWLVLPRNERGQAGLRKWLCKKCAIKQLESIKWWKAENEKNNQRREVIKHLVRGTTLKNKDIPDELISLKYTQIKLLRICRNQKTSKN
jgi:hypothetical protein